MLLKSRKMPYNDLENKGTILSIGTFTSFIVLKKYKNLSSKKIFLINDILLLIKYSMWMCVDIVYNIFKTKMKIINHKM